MTAEQLLQHPSMQKEFARFEQLGAVVSINDGNKVVLLGQGVVPDSIVQGFVARIQKLDTQNQLVVFIQ